MFNSMLRVFASYLSSSYMLPLWYSAAGIVLVGAATVFLKNLLSER